MSKEAEFVPPDIHTEYMGSLYRAFIIGKAEFITVDGWTTEYLRECARWATDKGYLDESFSDGDQYSCYVYRITKAGTKKLETWVKS